MKVTSLLAVALGLATAACYESTVPVTPEAQTFDASLIGTWQEIPAQGSGGMQLKVFRFNDHEYYVEMPEAAVEDSATWRMRVYLSVVAGMTFANVQEIQSEERTYAIFKVAHQNGEVHLQPLQQHAPKFKTSQELFGYLKAHAQDSTIFGEVGRFRKVD